VLEKPVMEFFYKNDVILENGIIISDPLMDCDENGIPKRENENFVLLDPNSGEKLNYMEIENPSTNKILTQEEIQAEQAVILSHASQIRAKTGETGRHLQNFYRKAGIEAFDGKIEYGLNPQ
jgi:phosphoribosylaminoimidazole-succinocarboxamide synthase